MCDNLKHYEIIVYGRVQGVGFRYAALNQARSLNLKGWVENLYNGSVRTVIQGDDSSCRAYIQWCRSGSGYSWVERMEISEKKLETLTSFVVRH